MIDKIILKMPTTESDGLDGINDSGIETYKNVPMLSLTKEELQNSCDAGKRNGKPVTVELSDFEISIEDVPNGDRLLEVYEHQRNFWDDYMENDKKVVEFFDNGIQLLKSGKIRVLRISDHNTTGLKGIEGKSSPWNNLVKNRFVSDKPGSAGGSFGIGKDAAFACSELRTVFYSTFNDDYEKAFQGVVRLPSYTYDEKHFTGDGYFSLDDGTKNNNPLRDCLSLEPGYVRNDFGMDKYILGFGQGLTKEEIRDELIISSIDNYLYAFYTGNLVVKYGDTIVDKEHLEDIFATYKDRINKLTQEYYETLKNPDKTEEVRVFEERDVRIFVKMDNDYSRRVAVLRQTGMKVFDKDRISGRIGFSSVVVLVGNKVNEYFKKLENAEHTQWSDYRSASREEANKKQNIFFGRLREIINELHIEDYDQRIDSEGTNEYLPFTYITGKKNKTEGLSNEIKEKKRKPKKKKKNPEVIFVEDEIHFEVDDLGNIIEDTIDVRKGVSNHGGGPNPNPGRDNNPSDDGIPTNTKQSDKFTARKQIPSNNLTFSLKQTDGVYSFNIISKESIKKGFIEVNLSGEQDVVKTKVLEAKVDGVLTEVNNNKIFIGSIEENKRHTISFELVDKGNYALEVNVYES